MRTKHINNHLTRLFDLKSEEKFQVLYEFDIPTIVGNEQDLKSIAQKNGLELYYQIRENKTPSMIRVMSRLTDFVDFQDSDRFVTKVDRILHNANIRMPERFLGDTRKIHCAIILDNSTIFTNFTYLQGWVVSNYVQGKFLRKEDQTLEDIIFLCGDCANIPVAYDDISFTLTRDSRDLENIWTLAYKLPVLGVHRNNETVINHFVSKAKEEFNMDNFKYIVSVI